MKKHNTPYRRKKTKYYRSLAHERFDKAFPFIIGCLAVCTFGSVTLATMTVFADSSYEVKTVEAEFIDIKNEYSFTEKELQAQAINYTSNIEKDNTSEVNLLDKSEKLNTFEENSVELEKEVTYIRCTGYCDTGYTASTEWTEKGCIAGKREWMGMTCNLYVVNDDNSIGQLIGTYTFKDTGFGLDSLDGVDYPNGTIKAGKSIDVWHPTEEECYLFSAKYGDYVYMEFVE